MQGPICPSTFMMWLTSQSVNVLYMRIAMSSLPPLVSYSLRKARKVSMKVQCAALFAAATGHWNRSMQSSSRPKCHSV